MHYRSSGTDPAPRTSHSGPLSFRLASSWFLSTKSNWFIGEKPKVNVTLDQIRSASDCVLASWVNDPQVIDRELCEEVLINRKKENLISRKKRNSTEEQVDVSTFNARTDISADAKHIAGRIVLNLWIICIVVPLVI